MKRYKDIESLMVEEAVPVTIDTTLGSIEYCDVGNGPPILSLHGAMGGFDQSLLLAKTLGETGYRYLALTRPGYLGTSIAGRHTPEAQADLTAAFLDAINIEKAAVMAVSGGGPNAIHFALRHRDRCRALVLVSTAASPVSNKLPLAFKITNLLMHIPMIARSALRKVENNPEQMAKRAITNPDVLKRTMENDAAWSLLKSLQRSTMSQMPKRYTGTVNDVELTRTQTYPLEAIEVPTLIVHGSKDPYVPLEQHGKVFHGRIPNAELVVLPGGEHAAIYSHRDEARAAVTQFLRRCGARG